MGRHYCVREGCFKDTQNVINGHRLAGLFLIHWLLIYFLSGPNTDLFKGCILREQCGGIEITTTQFAL